MEQVKEVKAKERYTGTVLKTCLLYTSLPPQVKTYLPNRLEEG